MSYLKKLRRRYLFLMLLNYFFKFRKAVYHDLFMIVDREYYLVKNEQSSLEGSLDHLNIWVISQFDLCRGTREILKKTSSEEKAIKKWNQFTKLYAKEVIKISDIRKRVVYGIKNS